MAKSKRKRKRPIVINVEPSLTPPPEQPDLIQKFRDSLERTNEKSQEIFEKQLTMMTAGSIVITVAFVADIVKVEDSRWKVLLYAGWVIMVVNLFINLFSHNISMKRHYATIAEIDSGPDNYNQERAEQRNKDIRKWNTVTIVLLITGLVLFFTFISVNLYDMQNKPKKDQKPLTEGLRPGASPPPQPPARPQPITKPAPKPNKSQNG